jgi:hypothetical protein
LTLVPEGCSSREKCKSGPHLLAVEQHDQAVAIG